MMHRRTTLTVALAILGAATLPLRAQASQDDPTDLQTRFGMSVSVALPKRLESTMEYELRMVNNATAYRGSYVTGELAYALRKRLSVFTSYRFARITDASAHRYAVGAQAEQKFRKKTTFSFRPMLQYQKQLLDDDGQRIDETTFLRTRLRGKRDMRKHFALYASVEPFFTFRGDFPIDNWRNTAGFQYEFAKRRKVDVHYIYRPDYSKVYNRTFHVIGAELALDVKWPR